MKKINICMVVHAYYPHDESRVKREAEALAEREYNVDVICLREGKEPKTGYEGGVNFYRLPVHRHPKAGFITYIAEYLLFTLFSSLLLVPLWLKKKYRIIQFHNPPDLLVFAGLMPKLFGAKVILDIHDLMPELYAAKFGVDMSHPLIRILLFLEKISCRFSNYVITVTDIWRDRLKKRGVQKRKCSVIMNLPDEKIFIPITATSQHHNTATHQHRSTAQLQHCNTATLQHCNTAFNLIYHGTLVQRYGVDIAIRAVYLLKDKIPGMKFNVLGEGDQMEELTNLVRELSLEKYVYLSKKFLPVEKLPGIISKMDVGIVPNRNDPFTDTVLNSKLLEYIGMCIPVIVSRTIGVKYYFNDSQVLFFEPENEKDLANKILYLYEHPEKRKSLLKNARKFLEKYNWQKEKQKYYQIIDSLSRTRL